MATPALTDGHEDELYDWLVTAKGYGTNRGQISSEREFKTRLQSILNKRSTFGVLEERLNIQNNLSRSPIETQYDQQLSEALDQVKGLEKELKEKIRELSARGASESQIQEITKDLEAGLRRARINYQQLLQQKGQIREAVRNELNLFDQLSGISKYFSIGKIVTDKPPGRTLCFDERYSTLPRGRGVCSYHGGIMMPAAEPAPKVVAPLIYYDQQEGNQWTAQTDLKDKTKRLREVIKARFPQASVRMDGDHAVISHRNFAALQQIGQFLYDNCSAQSDYARNKYLRISEVRPIYLRGNDIQTIVFCNELSQAPALIEEVETIPAASRAEALDFPIPDPKRGNLYSNQEYDELRSLVSSQLPYGNQENMFPVFRKLLKDINQRSQRIKDILGEKVYRSIFDESQFSGGPRAEFHPRKIFEDQIQYNVRDPFFQPYWYKQLVPTDFSKYKNRKKELVKEFLTNQFREAYAITRANMDFYLEPGWYDQSADPQELIYRFNKNYDEPGRLRLYHDFIKNLLTYRFGIDFLGSLYLVNERNDNYTLGEDGRHYRLSDLLRGKITLEEAEAHVRRKEGVYKKGQDESALLWKATIQDIFAFNRDYLAKSGSYHLPTYSRKLKERFGGLITGTSQSFSSGYKAHHYISFKYKYGYSTGFTITFPVIGDNPVLSILLGTYYYYNCIENKTTHQEIYFGCYKRVEALQWMENFLAEGGQVRDLYQVPQLSGFHFVQYYNPVL